MKAAILLLLLVLPTTVTCAEGTFREDEITFLFKDHQRLDEFKMYIFSCMPENVPKVTCDFINWKFEHWKSGEEKINKEQLIQFIEDLPDEFTFWSFFKNKWITIDLTNFKKTILTKIENLCPPPTNVPINQGLPYLALAGLGLALYSTKGKFI